MSHHLSISLLYVPEFSPNPKTGIRGEVVEDESNLIYVNKKNNMGYS